MPTYENRGTYLLVEKFDKYSLKSLLSCIQNIKEECELESLNKALVDISKMQGNVSILDRFQLGKEIAKVLGHKIKLAVVSNANHINYLGENSAVNRGARMKMFTDVKNAIEWLEEK